MLLLCCRAAAHFLLPLLDRAAFKGVCFYDAAAKGWMVLSLRGRCLPRKSSPIREAQVGAWTGSRCLCARARVCMWVCVCGGGGGGG